MSNSFENLEIALNVAELFIEKKKITNEYSDGFLKSN